MGKIRLLGLTGSIGMGKSETAKMFVRQNIPVFDSDQAVHDLMGPGGAAVTAVESAFPGVVTENAIDRKRLGARVFGDPAALNKLEKILHPKVSALRAQFVKQAEAAGHDLVVLDVPLLFETGGEAQCDHVIVVSAPAGVQRQRVLSRPGMTADKFEHILAKQLPDQQKRERADFIVQTDQGIGYAEDQVRAIIEKIRKTVKK